ncbi:NUDIX domain-containing protein [Streptomyces griseiscabiei]|uniref:NUDIX domain-containing protein n=1 Tax=Streptomyces griseiscabiei TaxID=2993540 RepID=UPI0037D9F0EE
MDELVERVDDRDRALGVVVSRRQAVREGWLHRVAVTVCRDEGGRILVHRRSERLSRFPGLYEVVVGGAVDVGESYEQAAARELSEELGIRVLPRLLFTFLNRGGLSPHWLGVHEAVVPDTVAADPDEVAWHGWLTGPELRAALPDRRFTPDSHEAFGRYLAFRAARSAPLVSGGPGMRITWVLGTHGWADCALEDQHAKVELTASHITSAPEEFLTAVARLLAGAAESRVQFEAEPTAYRWIFYREGDDIWIRVLELRDGSDHDNRGTEIWSSQLGINALARAVIRCFDEVAQTYGESGYRGKWGEHFPRAELEALRRLWRARRQLPDTSSSRIHGPDT